MSYRRPPQFDIDFETLPPDPAERHEELVDVFGRYLFWLRNWSVSATQELAESEEARAKLGTIWRKKYDELAALTPEQRGIAFEIAEASVDRFIQLFLTMMADMGTDQRLGRDHAIRFNLEMEICDVENGEVVDQETINRGGKKFFANYWGRWLNQFARE
ncbi:hypothetical protein GC170_00515 [bacterium]|nr:hypothetical protein [bacterium]